MVRIWVVRSWAVRWSWLAMSIAIGTAAVALCADDPPSSEPELERLFDAPIPFGLVEDGKVVPEARGDRSQFDLGRRLFFDPVLSIDRSTSCASCHRPDHGFSSVERLPGGANGQHAARHAPTLFNRRFGKSQSWDGRAASLRDQVLLPISNPVEMALPLDAALERLTADASYSDAFRHAFGRDADADALAIALTAFVDRLLLGDSRIDRFRASETVDLTPAERGGMWLFESKAGCWRCHTSRNFTDEQFHNTGIGATDGEPLPGRFAVTKNEAERGAFKTPTLRGLVATAPYMHDGSLATLRDVVEFYRRGGNANTHLDPKIKPIDLNENDVDHLVAFLEALSAPADSLPAKSTRPKKSGSGPEGRRIRLRSENESGR